MSTTLKCFLLPLISAVVGQKMSGFIVGGWQASIKDWPFMAYVYVYKDKDKVTSCGGSLISSQTVLTAAHCLDDPTDHKKNFGEIKFTILMGHTKLTNAIMRRSVLDFKTHEKYEKEETFHDIGVMFLTHPVEFCPTVKKVLLMTKEMGRRMVAEGDLFVAGWGRIGLNQNSSEVLKELRQPIIDSKLCNQYIYDDDDPGIICSSKVNDSDYAFSGDSGGPLARKRDQYLAGLVSWRIMRYGLTAYTSVPHYYSWIEQTQRTMFEENCQNQSTKRFRT